MLYKNYGKILNCFSSFTEIIDAFKTELKALRYGLLLDVINRMLEESAFHTSEKIFEILNNIKKHQKLENKLDIIIKGERFKVSVFLFMLPVVLGSIGGILPVFIIITPQISLSNDFLNYLAVNYSSSFLFLESILVFLIFLSSNSISAFYFIKTINFDSKIIILIISNIVYALLFLLTLTNFFYFIY